MAERKLAKTGKWTTAATWTPEGVPALADDMNLNESSFNAEVGTGSGKGRGIEASTYKGTLSITTGSITLGEATAAASNTALKFGASMTFSIQSGSTLHFNSTSSTVQSITTAGKTMPATEFGGTGGKYQLEDSYNASTATFTLVKGEVKLNGNTLTCGKLECTGAAVRVLDFTNATVRLIGTGVVWLVEGSGFTISGLANSTWEVTDTSTAAKTLTMPPGGDPIVLTVSGDNVTPTLRAGGLGEQHQTIPTVNVNTKRKPFKVKATLTNLSNHLVVTAEEGGTLEVGQEVTGTGIPQGTYLVKKIEAGVWEMSANATQTVVVAEAVEVFQAGLLLNGGTKLTCTTAFTSNGTASEPARLATNAAQTHHLIKSSGRVIAKGLRLRNSEAEGGAEFYAPPSNGCVDCGGNTGWKFEDAPPIVLALAAANSSSAATNAVAAKTSVGLAASAAASTALLTATAVPKLSLTALAVSAATGVIRSPQPLALSASASTSAASAKVGVQTPLELTPAIGKSASALGLNAPTRIALVASASSSAAGLPLHATPQLVLTAVSASSATATVHATPKFACVASSTSAASMTVKVKVSLQLAASAATSGALGEILVPGKLALHPAQASSGATLRVRAATQLPLAAASAQSGSALTLRLPQFLVLTPASGASGGALVLRANARLGFASGASTSVGHLNLGVPVRLALVASASSSAGSFSLFTRVNVSLAPAFSISHTFSRLSTRQVVTLVPASSVSTSSLHVFITQTGRAKVKLQAAYPVQTVLQPAGGP